MAPTSAFGSVVRNAYRSLVVSPSFTFRTEVQLVQMPAKHAMGRVSSSANQMSPPSALLNSLKELNGTMQRFSTPSQRVQCLLFTFRILVVPPSGSILSNSLKSTGLPLAFSFSARFLVASINVFDDDGMPIAPWRVRVPRLRYVRSALCSPEIRPASVPGCRH